MRKFYTLLMAMGLMLPAAAFACHNSEFNLVSMQTLGNNEYEFTVQFCVGHGCDTSGLGADAYTGRWAVYVDNGTAINTFPATLTSPATGAVYTGYTNIYGDSLLLFERSIIDWSDTWACVDHTCTPVMQACKTFTFTTIGLPNNIVLMGAEGQGVGVAPYGCNGLDKMEIHLTPVANAGADQEVIYGWGSNCVNLVGAASGGTPPYSYSWSDGSTTSATNVCPTSNTTYTLTVTDSNGKTSSDDVVVAVNDVRCGGNNDRVVLCHRGNRTKCVRQNRVQRHLNHGDQLGACPSNRLAMAMEPDVDHGLFIYPNPASDFAELEFVTDDDGEVNIVIFTVEGKKVQEVTSGLEVKMDDINYVDVNMDNLENGVYMVILESSSGERMVKKLHVVR